MSLRMRFTNAGASLSQAALVVLIALLDSRAGALEITDSVQPPPESCKVDPAHQAPAQLVDCLDLLCYATCVPTRGDCRSLCTVRLCGRLIPSLRAAAQTRDAEEILVRAALDYYVLERPELLPIHRASPLVAQALADLAVTGQAAYSSFRQLAPRESSLVGPLQLRLQSVFPSHVQLPGARRVAVQRALNRSYAVAWALRGPTPYRIAHREHLGWIAVEGEDDPPHRPVNLPSAPFPQVNMTVRVDGIDVMTRYMVASRQLADDHPVDVGTIPPDREHPLIIGDIVLFIPGHSSSAEEAVPLAEQLLAQAEARGRPVTLIAMDLPSNGYASMIEHTTVAPASASSWNSGYPILEFIEEFVVAFVDELEARQPGIKMQIVGVLGGSLGGNMGLRLGRRDPALFPWLRNVVSWSPASSWESWARAVLANPSEGRPYDFVKHEAVRHSRDRMSELENLYSLYNLFYETAYLVIPTGRIEQSERWYSESWPCRKDAIDASHLGVYEVYNERFRRWHWRVGHEQLIFSHWDSDNADPAVDPDPRYNPGAGPPRYSEIRARLMLATGSNDNHFPEFLFENSKRLARSMSMVDGFAYFIEDTGHSIHAEKPAFFAGRILDFLFASPPPPFPYFLVPATSF